VSALVIDTSSWISYFAGTGSALVDEALAEGRVHITPIVAAELLSGRLTPRRRGELEDLLSDLPTCVADLDHWFRVGALRAGLRTKGLNVSTPDAHVAQSALDMRADLLTEDALFRRIAAHRPLRLVG
jgi:predicted nucleic acid-binding protein